MKEFSVEVAKEAIKDIIKTHRYIMSEFNDKFAADDIRDRLIAKIETLNFSPIRHKVVGNIYSVRVKKYKIFYNVNEKSLRVRVIAVAYGRRNMSRKLLDKLGRI